MTKEKKILPWESKIKWNPLCGNCLSFFLVNTVNFFKKTKRAKGLVFGKKNKVWHVAAVTVPFFQDMALTDGRFWTCAQHQHWRLFQEPPQSLGDKVRETRLSLCLVGERKKGDFWEARVKSPEWDQAAVHENVAPYILHPRAPPPLRCNPTIFGAVNRILD